MLPPDVNASGYMFEAIDPATIRYGLGAVKGVGRGACEAIAAERAAAGPFGDLLDFCRRVGTARFNRRTLEALIQSGAMDALGSQRASLMLQLPEVVKACDQLARERDAGQVSLFGGGGEAEPELRIELPEADPWPLAQTLAGERETLGHYLSGHPIDPYREELTELVGHDLGGLDAVWATRPEDARSWRPEVQTIVAGLVTAMRRRGESQAFVQLEDGRGRLECAFFAEAWQEYAPLLTRDRILIVEGGLREDEFSGGFALRARRCWDFQQLCPQIARRLWMRLDLRERDLLARIERLLAPHRPGQTPIRFDLLVPAGAAGSVDLNGDQAVRVDAELLGQLRAQPGVRGVRVALQRPWG